MNVGFIGLGKLGLPCAEAMATKYSVTGFDIEDRSSDSVKVVTDVKDAVENQDLVFVAIQTPHHPQYDGSTPCMDYEPQDFNYDQVKQCLEEVNQYANEHTLIVLISTVLPGTVRRELAPLITRARFIYNPYLIAMGSVAWDMVNPEMVIIGTEDGSETGDASLLINFYKELMQNNPRYSVGTWEEAESIKIFYNTFISAKLSLVNMIQDVAEKSGNMDVDVVTGALERSTYRILGKAYMKAGMGDGGGCHPRDNIALRYMAEKLGLGYDLFDAIMRAREVQAKNIATKLVIESDKVNLPIVILGEAYKPDVHYKDGSSSILVGHYCEAYGSAKKVTYDPIKPIKAVYLLGHMGKHHDYNFPEGSVVVDP